MHSLRHVFSLMACITLAAPAFGAENSFDGTYTGERVLTKGEAGACAAKDPVSVVIHGDELTFTDSRAKNYTMAFTPDAYGSFEQLSTAGDAVVSIKGHIGDSVLDSDVSREHCTHHWHPEKRH